MEWNIRIRLDENLELHVSSGAAFFTLLLRRRVAFLHRTATCRPLFNPWVSLLSTYRQSSCVSNFYRILKFFIWLSLVYFIINYEKHEHISYPMNKKLKHKLLFKLWTSRKGEHNNTGSEYFQKSGIWTYRYFCLLIRI